MSLRTQIIPKIEKIAISRKIYPKKFGSYKNSLYLCGVKFTQEQLWKRKTTATSFRIRPLPPTA